MTTRAKNIKCTHNKHRLVKRITQGAAKNVPQQNYNISWRNAYFNALFSAFIT